MLRFSFWCLRPRIRTSLNYQPEAQHPKIFSYPQAAGRLPHLIQLTPTPRLMVRSPERFAITRARHDLIRHLVLLTGKITDENRSRPQSEQTSVQEMDAYGAANQPDVQDVRFPTLLLCRVRLSTTSLSEDLV